MSGWRPLRKLTQPVRSASALLWAAGAAILVWSLAARLLYASDRASSWDAVDFVLALDRFDLLAMQPHFPGYPYFVLGGMAIRRWVENPAAALSVLNAGALFTAALPVYLLARRRLEALPAFLAAVCVQTMPYLWVLGAQPMSEGVGAALVLWYAWAVVRAYERPTIRSQLAAVAFYGLLSGVRLSFFPVGAGLLALWWRDWRLYRRRRRLLLFAGAFGAGQLLWAAVLLLSEGSVSGFAELAAGFVSGHFREWGGGVGASSVGWGERMYRFLLGNSVWTGLMGQSALMLGVWCAMAAAAAAAWAGAARDAGSAPGMSADQPGGITRRPDGLLLAGMAVCYGLWAWIGQNIDKPRHTVPMVLLLLLALLPRLARRMPGGHAAAAALLLVLAGAQSAAGTAAVRLMAAETPAVHQLGDAMDRLAEAGGPPFILFTWEETRVLQDRKAAYPHKRIFTYDYFLAEAAALEGHRILLTGKVTEGFRAQGAELNGQVKQVAEFRSSPLFDPVYHHIVLYEWVSGEEKQREPGIPAGGT